MSKIRHSLDGAIISQNAIKPGFFVTSSRNSGEIESVFHYDYAKQTQFPKKSNERKSIQYKGL